MGTMRVLNQEGDIKMGWIPAGDDLICKMMLARHDEERMVVVANRHPA